MEAVDAVCRHPDEFSDNIRAKLVTILDTEIDDLQLELAIVSDSCNKLVKFCYHNEGDSFLAPRAYQLWEDVRMHGRAVTGRLVGGAPAGGVPLAPLTSAVAQRISAGNAVEHARILSDTVGKSHSAFDKMDQDSNERLRDTLAILRGARLFDYTFIAAQPIAAVMGELIHLQLHPKIAPLQASLLAELALYHEEAVAAAVVYANPTPDQQWQFWRARKLILKVWYPAACTIALVMSSSACVERIFALYESMFTDEQENALQDYKSAAIMIRFNTNQRRMEELERHL
jgi:hypothetical protein